MLAMKPTVALSKFGEGVNPKPTPEVQLNSCYSKTKNYAYSLLKKHTYENYNESEDQSQVFTLSPQLFSKISGPSLCVPLGGRNTARRTRGPWAPCPAARNALGRRVRRRGTLGLEQGKRCQARSREKQTTENTLSIFIQSRHDGMHLDLH